MIFINNKVNNLRCYRSDDREDQSKQNDYENHGDLSTSGRFEDKGEAVDESCHRGSKKNEEPNGNSESTAG